LNVYLRYRAIVIANRDEFRARGNASLGPWAERSVILASGDLQAGGTWCSIDRNRRMGLVTNYRELARPRRNAPTLGTGQRFSGDVTGARWTPRVTGR